MTHEPMAVEVRYLGDAPSALPLLSRIPLRRILHVDACGDDELILWLFDGKKLRLRMKHARAWKARLDTQMEEAQSSASSTITPRK